MSFTSVRAKPGVVGIDQRSAELGQGQIIQRSELLVDDPPVLGHRLRRPVPRCRGNQVPPFKKVPKGSLADHSGLDGRQQGPQLLFRILLSALEGAGLVAVAPSDGVAAEEHPELPRLSPAFPDVSAHAERLLG